MSNGERIFAEAVERGAKCFHVGNFASHQELQCVFAALIVGQMDQSLIGDFGACFSCDIVSQIDIQFACNLQVVRGPRVANRVKEVESATACDGDEGSSSARLKFLFIGFKCIRIKAPTTSK